MTYNKTDTLDVVTHLSCFHILFFLVCLPIIDTAGQLPITNRLINNLKQNKKKHLKNRFILKQKKM